MDDKLFALISGDYYVRHYELNPELFGGTHCTILTECSPNTSGVNGHKYALEIYFSVDNYSIREFIIGATFGTGAMKKGEIDKTIDSFVAQTISESAFIEDIRNYLNREEMWENFMSDNETGGDQSPK